MDKSLYICGGTAAHMEQPLTLSFDNPEFTFAYKTDKELRQARLIFSAMRFAWLVKVGTVLTRLALQWRLPVRGLIRRTIFQQFCGGETLAAAARTAARLGRFGVAVILDYGVEAAEGEENYDQAVPEFRKAIAYAAGQPNIPFVSIKVTGFARVALLEKIHAGAALLPGEEEEMQRVRDRIHAICRCAAEHRIGVLIDAEQSWIQRPVDALADEMMETYNREEVIVYNTFQLYLRDKPAFLQASLERSGREGYLLGAKLVRGAYMEKERRRAAEQGYPSPVQPDKASTDRAYNEAMGLCLGRLDRAGLFIGTHNEESCMLGASMLHEKGIPHDHPHVHFSQLYGMSDNITFNLARAGYRVSKYLPYGPVEEVLPYLIRRAQENSAISGQTGRELGLIHEELRRRQAL